MYKTTGYIGVKPDQYETLRFLNTIKKCNFDINTLPKLYSILSHDIHGAAWSGPGVKARLSLFNSESEKCLMKSIIKDLDFEIIDVVE